MFSDGSDIIKTCMIVSNDRSHLCILSMLAIAWLLDFAGTAASVGLGLGHIIYFGWYQDSYHDIVNYSCLWCSDSTFVFFCDKLMVIWNVGCGVKYVLTYIVFWYCQNSNSIGYHLQWGWFWAMPLSLFNAHSLSTWSICWLGVYMYSDCLWDYADHIYQLHFYRVSHTASHVSYALLRRSWYLCIAMTRRWFSSGAYTLVVS